ncbi:hypothetical protein TCAL_13074 [Tigriopus californicus]|uniref:Uncharacterized protein n=1 Tax=Tigriopus californicus TaxID=6832 RepID=A0A553PPR7_TIGCA|nr:hypothetical protein TCAL_13074 [Tigriopus californicus]
MEDDVDGARKQVQASTCSVPGSNGAPSLTRLVTALKPDTSEIDASCAVFRNWWTRFNDYY